MKTITVRGQGSYAAKPDYVELTLVLEARATDYDEAMAAAAVQLEQIDSSLQSAGFAKGSAKTTVFNVRTEYENVKDEGDTWQNVFKGYLIYQNLSVGFGFDTALLAQTLTALSSSEAKPSLTIEFTLKNVDEAKERLLEEISANALKKARILCSASGVRLGSLQSINYSWEDSRPVSRSEFSLADSMAPRMMKAAIEFSPDDIQLTDNATFVWEIVEVS